ncbi:MAG: hypothetical protein ACOYMG_12605 [Candidatus Methylumidiphilus sp.]
MLRKQDAARERPEPPPWFAEVHTLSYEERCKKFAADILPFVRVFIGDNEVLCNRNLKAIIRRPKTTRSNKARKWETCWDRDASYYATTPRLTVEYYYNEGDEENLHQLDLSNAWAVCEAWGFAQANRFIARNTFGLDLDGNRTQGEHRHE